MWKPKEYVDLSLEKFDAVITGELTHQLLHCEGEVNGIISKYFCREGTERDFRRLLLYRDGLNVQDKLEIVRAMLPLIASESVASRLKVVLKKVEDLKSLRNAFAHGWEVFHSLEGKPSITVEIVGRSGAEKRITVTPETHCQTMKEAEELCEELRIIREELAGN